MKSKSATSQVEVQKPILTERRLEYLSLIALGLSNTEIGKILCVEENTVKKTLEEICKKLKTEGRTHTRTYTAVSAVALGVLTIRKISEVAKKYDIKDEKLIVNLVQE